MALGKIKIDTKNSDMARKYLRALQLINEGVELLSDVRASCVQCKMDDGDGQGSQVVGPITQEAWGAATLLDAQDATGELESIEFKLTTNASQVDVGNAIPQALARVD